MRIIKARLNRIFIAVKPTLPVLVLLLTVNLARAQPQHPVPYPRVENAVGYKVDPAWPLEKPPGGEWSAAMSSVAIAPDGAIWTFNRGKIPVQVYSPEGKLVRYWGGGQFKNPHTIRFDCGFFPKVKTARKSRAISTGFTEWRLPAMAQFTSAMCKASVFRSSYRRAARPAADKRG